MKVAIRIGLIVVAAIFVAVVLGVYVLMRQDGPGMRYVLPENFSGCCDIVYDLKSAGPLPEEDGQYVIDVKRDGDVIKTSSSFRSSNGRRIEYFEVIGGKRVLMSILGPRSLVTSGTAPATVHICF
jgi:hypothetical protein